MLSFIIERAFHTDLNHSLRFIVPESTVLDFACGLWTEKKIKNKILVSLIVLCHSLYQLSWTVHLYPFAKLLYKKKKRNFFRLQMNCWDNLFVSQVYVKKNLKIN